MTTPNYSTTSMVPLGSLVPGRKHPVLERRDLSTLELLVVARWLRRDTTRRLERLAAYLGGVSAVDYARPAETQFQWVPEGARALRACMRAEGVTFCELPHCSAVRGVDLPCGHGYCMGCFRANTPGHLRGARTSPRGAVELARHRCPLCRAVVPVELFRRAWGWRTSSNVPDATLHAIEQWPADRTAAWCARPDCSAVVDITGTCVDPEFGEALCPRCEVLRYRRCPRCRAPVATGECDVVTCACRASFCFACGKVFSQRVPVHWVCSPEAHARI